MNGAMPERSGRGDDCCEPFPRSVGEKKGLGLGLRLSLSKPRRSESESDDCSEPSSQSQGNNINLNPCKRQKIAAKVKELPEDILVDILMTLPVKSLDAIDFRVSAPCDGLLCGVVKRVERVSLILWNPSLREYVELAAPPHPKIFRSVNGIGYNPHADEYKVVRIVPGPDFVEYKPVVYVLGLKTNLWKRIPSISPISLLGHSEISINGSIYWTDQSGSLVIRFDLVTLKFSLVAQFFVKHWHKTLLMNIGGSLCVAALGSKRDHFVRVWSLSPNNTWNRLLTLHVVSSFINICMLPHFTWSSAFLLRILFRKLFEFYTNYYGIGFSPGDKPYYEDLKQAYCYKESLLSPRHLLCHPSESEPSSL
nr:hypothetical protein CFP56_45175 [Quercus suber]